ncbi:hypothetical protein ACRALDRAFT_211140 [Sodiomyces alcalophilus JCM 7366]|uniref:uncharacterized protein n=1 Tax=Sodiomyces alcalophilus JCM 7366 TaxID=591952 RepID=UPI0039B5A9C4
MKWFDIDHDDRRLVACHLRRGSRDLLIDIGQPFFMHLCHASWKKRAKNLFYLVLKDSMTILECARDSNAGFAHPSMAKNGLAPVENGIQVTQVGQEGTGETRQVRHGGSWLMTIFVDGSNTNVLLLLYIGLLKLARLAARQTHVDRHHNQKLRNGGHGNVVNTKITTPPYHHESPLRRVPRVSVANTKRKERKRQIDHNSNEGKKKKKQKAKDAGRTDARSFTPTTTAPFPLEGTETWVVEREWAGRKPPHRSGRRLWTPPYEDPSLRCFPYSYLDITTSLNAQDDHIHACPTE